MLMSCWKRKALQSLPLSCTAWGGAQGCGDLSLRPCSSRPPCRSATAKVCLQADHMLALAARPLASCSQGAAARRTSALRTLAPFRCDARAASWLVLQWRRPPPPPPAARAVWLGSASCKAAAAPESPAACCLPRLTAFQCCPISHALLNCRHMSSSQAATRRRSATASPVSYRVNASAASLATDDVQVIPPATGSLLSPLRLLMHHCTASWRLHCCPQGAMLDKPSVANKNWARVAAVAGAPAV